MLWWHIVSAWWNWTEWIEKEIERIFSMFGMQKKSTVNRGTPLRWYMKLCQGMRTFDVANAHRPNERVSKINRRRQEKRNKNQTKILKFSSFSSLERNSRNIYRARKVNQKNAERSKKPKQSKAYRHNTLLSHSIHSFTRNRSFCLFVNSIQKTATTIPKRNTLLARASKALSRNGLCRGILLWFSLSYCIHCSVYICVYAIYESINGSRLRDINTCCTDSIY